MVSTNLRQALGRVCAIALRAMNNDWGVVVLLPLSGVTYALAFSPLQARALSRQSAFKCRTLRACGLCHTLS